MPASNEYDYYYFLGMVPPDGTTIVSDPAQLTANTVNDTKDGIDDNSTVVGRSLDWSQSILDVELFGLSSTGDPIVKVMGAIPSYFLLSDYNGWQGQALGSVTFDAYTYCFLPCTKIACPEQEVPVGELRIGDRVVTSDGKELSVRWIGRQVVHASFGPAERLMPVRFAAGSLGGGLPYTDLMVTADHGMLLDGVICHAGALVNGVSISRVPLAELGRTFTVYHIETEAHEIILANGAPAETFIDNVSRRSFDNFAEFEALYGDVPEMEELPYPRAMSARQVPERIRNGLAPALTA